MHEAIGTRCATPRQRENPEVVVRRFILPTLLAFLVSASSARAELIFFDTFAAFNAATTGLTLIDFEGLAPDHGELALTRSPGLTVAGTNFSFEAPADLDPFVFGRGLFEAEGSIFGINNSVLGLFGGGGQDPNIFVTLPRFVSAFALDIGITADATFSLSTGDVFDQHVGGLDFIGVVSTVPFNTLTITTLDGVAIDNFGYGDTTTSVPEPSTALLIVTGLVMAAFRRPKRTRQRVVE